MSEVQRKLAAARTRLILDKPFLGALVLRLPLKEADASWCASSATDARSIYYNTDYLNPLSLSQVQFVLAHEALHCGLSHFARREHRDLNRWNIACDHAVNPLLVADGLELPPGALYNEAYLGLSAEEIYPLIKTDSDEKTQDQHLYDQPPPANPDQARPDDATDQSTENRNNRCPPAEPPRSPQASTTQSGASAPTAARQLPEQPGHAGQDSGGQDPPSSDGPHSADNVTAPTPQPPAPLNATEKARLTTQWQQRLASAAQQASQAGKMNGSVARLVQRLLRSTVPWRTLLARFMSGASRIDYNMMRPSQRRSGDAILPSLYARQIHVLIALDTSGSIEQQELAMFIAEINALKSLVNAKITLLACDRQLDENGPWVAEPWETLTLPKTLQGGGGTDFSPVFDWLLSTRIQVDLVIYFTDARGRFPEHPPAAETLWLVKGSAQIPWGQRIQLN